MSAPTEERSGPGDLPFRRSLPPELLIPGDWETRFYGRWRHEEHITVTEARAAIMTLEHATRDKRLWGTRILAFVDNEAVVGALNKGRSSRPDLLALCRRSLALQAATSCRPRWRYIITAVNPADAPSRMCAR